MFPPLLIVRYYESGIIDLAYSDELEDKEKIWDSLDLEMEEDKHLETYKIFENWEGISKEVLNN